MTLFIVADMLGVFEVIPVFTYHFTVGQEDVSGVTGCSPMALRASDDVGGVIGFIEVLVFLGVEHEVGIGYVVDEFVELAHFLDGRRLVEVVVFDKIPKTIGVVPSHGKLFMERGALAADGGGLDIPRAIEGGE